MIVLDPDGRIPAFYRQQIGDRVSRAMYSENRDERANACMELEGMSFRAGEHVRQYPKGNYREVLAFVLNEVRRQTMRNMGLPDMEKPPTPAEYRELVRGTGYEAKGPR